jgi:hypothetical protein
MCLPGAGLGETAVAPKSIKTNKYKTYSIKIKCHYVTTE